MTHNVIQKRVSLPRGRFLLGMTGVQEKTLILRRLALFLRSCREEGVPAERAREALTELGFDRSLIAEADRGIDDPALLEGEQEDDHSALIPTLAKLRLEVPRPAPEEESPRVPHQAPHLSIVPPLPPSSVAPPPPPVAAPGLMTTATAQILAEAPLLAAAEVTGPVRVEAPNPYDDGLILPPPFVSDALLRKVVRAGPAALTVILVAWAALHMPPPQASKPTLHIHEALMAPPAPIAASENARLARMAQAPTQGPGPGPGKIFTPDQIPEPVEPTAESFNREPASVAPAAAAVDSPAADKNDADGDIAQGKAKPLSPRALYHRLKSALHAGLRPMVSSFSVAAPQDLNAPKLLDKPAVRPESRPVWWHEDEASHAVVPDTIDQGVK